MYVLIVGGNRFVGVQLGWRLLAAGHRVSLFNRGTLPDPFGDRVERLRGDRTTEDFERLLTGRSFDSVVDFAAFTGEDVERAITVLRGQLAHYIFISSGQVYLVRETYTPPSKEEDYDGPVLPRPDDPAELSQWLYGVGKRAGEDALVAAWERDRFPSTRLRIPMVNGERDYARRVESYLWRILDGGPVLLPDGGTNPTRHVYSGEVARAICAILGDERTFGEAYNLCQEEMPTLVELVELMARLLGAPSRLAPISNDALLRAGLDPHDISPFSTHWMSCVDPSKARRDLGFEHEPLETYLGKIVASFLAFTPSEPPEDYRNRDVEVRMA